MLVSTTGIFQNVFNQSVGIAGTNFVAMGKSFSIRDELIIRSLSFLSK